ncbi:MAG: hypothetical protein HKP38_01300 [Croceitalea sp.]|nr:hypothetical protein [Croceitalea sp.]MBT8237895.1 hypothetical protein [Croceitalea sp.]NNL07839.1 hypothetical protein [Croceitalea sp.]NNM19162.1 hypothetical protein [Croceitalea sp.]
MLLNVSYTDKKVTQKIESEVGKPFTLKERIKMNGIGSPKLFITETSIDIHNLLVLDNNRNSCNIEMRPNGIIVRFRSLLETFALIIPFYKLTIYKGDIGIYSIYRDNYFIKVQADTKAIQKYFRKILDYKADNAPTSIDDL